MRRPETRVRLDCRDLLKQVGFAVWDMEQNRRTRQTPGFPDLFALGHGLILFIECKAPGRKSNLSDDQKLFRDECLANGGLWICVDDVRGLFDWLADLGVIEKA